MRIFLLVHVIYTYENDHVYDSHDLITELKTCPLHPAHEKYMKWYFYNIHGEPKTKARAKYKQVVESRTNRQATSWIYA